MNYSNKFQYVLSKCQWANVISGRECKKDEFEFTLVKFSRLIYSGNRLIDKLYVLAPQALQVFYVEDVRHKDWVVLVVKTKPRVVFDVGFNASHDDDDDDE